MCEPTTIAAVATLAVGAYQGYNQYQAGKAQAAQYQQEAKIDRAAAADAMAMGDRESERMLWRTRQALGSQQAAIAAAGIDPTFGTPAEILGETAMFGQMEVADARLNAARNAWGYDVQATNAENSADFSRWNGRTQAIGTVLGSMGQAYGMYSAGRPSSSRAKIGPVQKEKIAFQPNLQLDPVRF